MTAVFVTDFVHLEVSFDELAPVLLDEDAGWLRDLEEPTSPASAAPAGEAGEEADAGTTVRVRVDGKRSRQAVMVTAGRARVHDRTVIVPIMWEPIVLQPPLPKLEADLELSALGESVTRLAINGRYRVPVGQLGRSLDSVSMRRLAESSLRRFLHDVQEAVLAEL